jgi:hypothetical protein
VALATLEILEIVAAAVSPGHWVWAQAEVMLSLGYGINCNKIYIRDGADVEITLRPINDSNGLEMIGFWIKKRKEARTGFSIESRQRGAIFSYHQACEGDKTVHGQ